MKHSVKRGFALLLILAMLMGLVGAIPAQAADAAAVTINVADYFEDSHEVNGVKEATTAVERALAAAKKLPAKTPKIISFPKGEYHFYADYAPEREYYVSNTAGINQSLKMKRVGILVEDMDNVTIDGGGSSFIYHGNITTFAAVRSKNVLFTNYEFDHASPSVVDVTVESKVPGENAVIAYIPPAYTYEINGTTLTWKGEKSPVTGQPYWQGDNSLQHQQGLDTLEGKKNGGGQSALFNGVTKMEDLGGGRVKITYSGSTPKVGYCFQMRNTTRVTPGVFIWESEDVTLKDIRAHFLHGFGLVAQLSKNVTIDNVDFRAKPGTGRTTASFADFLQMSSVGGKVIIKNCDFYDPQDDPINIHGTFLSVSSVSSDNQTFTLKYRHNETGGFPQYYVGDQVDFSAMGTMLPVDSSLRTVTEVKQPGTNGLDLNTTEITLNAPLTGITGGDNFVVENVTYTPEVLIQNNRFVETPTRGILVTTRQPVVIENNYFDAMGMASIFISCDANPNNGWFESGHTENVIIRNNVFDRLSAGSGAIFVEPTGSASRANQVHSNMLIENNVFNLEGNVPVVNAKSVKNLTIQNNIINRADPDVSLELTADNETVPVGGTQATALAKSGAQRTGSLYKLYGCVGVTIQDNTYDAGLNQSVELNNGTLPADVTVVGDDLKVNSSSNQKPAVDKVLYFSTDPAVATVDANGVVKGVSAGTAEIFAYTVSGVRVFESNRLTFTVSGTSGGGEEAPTAITVSTEENKDKINVADTLQFTAVTDPAEQAITWSVRDAVTLGATDVASIGTNGLLTALKPGVVEVLATSTTDGTVYGSKLVTVRMPDGGKSAAWTIDREVPEAWAVNDNGTLTITAQSGGDWNTGKAAKNLFLTDMPAEDFSFTVELQNKTSGTSDMYDEAGLIVFKDADNYVAMERKNANANPQLAFATESNSVATEDPTKADISEKAVFLKITKTGDSYTGAYSADGTTWTDVRTVTNTSISGAKIGVLACNYDGTPKPTFTFANFKIGSTPVPFLSTNHDPVASAPAITTEDTTLTLDYTFTDPDSDTQGNSLFAWYAADSETGIYRRIPAANAATLTVTPALSEKYIKAAVVPVDQGGRTGAPVYAVAIQAPAVAGDQTDATLSALEIYGVALSPAFSGDVTAYSALLPPSASARTVTTTPSQPDAKVVVEQTADNITVTVTAPDKTTTKTYTVTLTHAKDNNSALETLNLTGDATLSLDGDKRYYQLLVDSDVESLQLDTAAASTDARLEVRFNYEILNDYDSAGGSYPLALVGGLNFVEVRTLAEDGVSTRIYRVAIMKTPSSEAGLASLTVNGASVPGFDSGKDTYHLDVQAGTVTFAATAKSEKAKVEYFLDGVAATSPATLSGHLTTLTVKVTAENTSTVRTYTVHLVIPAANSTDLISFSTGNVALTPGFDPEVTAYTANVSQQTLPLSVLAVEGKTLITAQTDSAFFRGLGKLDAAIPLTDGVNTITVTITSPDGTATKTYTLAVTKTNSVYLSDLEWVSATTGYNGWNNGLPAKDIGWEDTELGLTNEAGAKEVFAKGLGTHADSIIVYDLSGKGYETFTAKVGVSYKKHSSSEPNLTFKVLGDGTELHKVESMKGNTPYKSISLDVKGVSTLTLEVIQPANNYSAHGSWADTMLTAPARAPGQQYPVTVTETEHASLWAERKQTAAGETVTVHVDDIADGYQFTSLTVKAADETAVETTTVEAGKVFTFIMPAQAVTVSAKVDIIPTSSGSDSDTTTTVKPNPDGSTTTTVTNRRTGTVTVTTKYKDGVSVQTVTTKSGDSVSTVKLPSGVEKANVVIPAKDVKPGTVAVIVKADGTQEIVKYSVAVDGGVKVTLTAGAQLKLIDNTKSFTDVAATHWAADAVQFAASRELFQGTGKDGFSPAGDMTRSMLVTVLARLDSQDVSGGETWYSKAMEWAKEQGITDGSNVDASITRESLAVMLYRFAGQPGTEKTDKTFADLDSVSSWATDAMNWAVSAGILNGRTGDLLAPDGTATRAEVAAILQRFVTELQK